MKENVMEKLLSVSIAAYNVEKTLEEALIPFTGEKIRDRVDVMIVDDGSKDKTAEIAKDYQARFPGTFRLISKENGGWGSTLNTGFDNAVGKYFKQLDGDDYFSAENLPAFLDFLEKCHSDLISSPFQTFRDGSGELLHLYGEDERLFGEERKISGFLEFAPAMHSLTVKTELLRKNHIRILEHCFYTDVEFVLKAVNCGQDISYFDQPIYYYRLARDGQSMSIGGVRKHYDDHLKMLFHMLEYEKSEVKDETKKKIFERRLASACNMQYVFFFALENTKQHKKELLAYDRRLRAEFPDYYAIPQGNIIDIGRKLSFTPRWLFAGAKMHKDRKEKANIFEGAL